MLPVQRQSRLLILDPNRLKVAKSLVPRVRTVQVQKNMDAKAVAASIRESLGEEAKLVIECTGVENSIHTAIYVSATDVYCTR